MIPVTVLVMAGRAEPVLPAAGSAESVTAATGLVTLGWVGLETVEIAPVRLASEPTGFGPEVAAVAVGWAEVVWVLPVSAPVTVVAVCGALAVGAADRAGDAGHCGRRGGGGRLAGGLAPGGLRRGGLGRGRLRCGRLGTPRAGSGPRPVAAAQARVAPLTVPVTPLTAPARPLVAGGGEPAAWPAPLAVADGCAGAAGWLAGCAALGWAALGWAGAVWAGAGWDAAGWAGAGCDELAGAEAGGGAAGWAEPDGGGLGWVRLCTALLAAPVSELSADPAPLVPDDPGAPEDPGSVAAEARPARRNAKMSAAAIPPQTHRETLRARPKALVRVADPSTARRLHRVPIIIHTYPPFLSGQNRRSEADNLTDVLPDHT